MRSAAMWIFVMSVAALPPLSHADTATLFCKPSALILVLDYSANTAVVDYSQTSAKGQRNKTWPMAVTADSLEFGDKNSSGLWLLHFVYNRISGELVFDDNTDFPPSRRSTSNCQPGTSKSMF